jgi:hypothetical protein
MITKRISRVVAVVTAIAALAPTAAFAKPVRDPLAHTPAAPEPARVVSQPTSDGADQTLALVISGAALLVAAGAAARSVKLTRTA